MSAIEPTPTVNTQAAAANMTDVHSRAPLQLWAGFECTLNRVGDVQHDQLELTGHYRRLDDGRFLLYSVGWDEVDNGGTTNDWVWPDSAKWQ